MTQWIHVVVRVVRAQRWRWENEIEKLPCWKSSSIRSSSKVKCDAAATLSSLLLEHCVCSNVPHYTRNCHGNQPSGTFIYTVCERERRVHLKSQGRRGPRAWLIPDCTQRGVCGYMGKILWCVYAGDTCSKKLRHCVRCYVRRDHLRMLRQKPHCSRLQVSIE